MTAAQIATLKQLCEAILACTSIDIFTRSRAERLHEKLRLDEFMLDYKTQGRPR